VSELGLVRVSIRVIFVRARVRPAMETNSSSLVRISTGWVLKVRRSICTSRNNGMKSVSDARNVRVQLERVRSFLTKASRSASRATTTSSPSNASSATA